MITLEEAKEYTSSQGVELPDIVMNILVDQANSINDCLNANYDERFAKLIQIYLIGLLAYTQADKLVTSQSGPNGASISFKYQDMAMRWRGAYNLLRSLDKKGCTKDLLPDPPFDEPRGGIWIGRAGKMR